AVVREETGIDQHRTAAEERDHRQAVRVSVRGAGYVVRSQAARLLAAVEADVVGGRRPVAATDEVAARGERHRAALRRRRLQPVEALEAVHAEEPQRVFVKT